jgi:broad specificity phosphatase PhoE
MPIPDGETGEVAKQRIFDFLEETWQLHNTGNIILVSHDGLIRLLMFYIVDIPVYKRWNFRVDTCGIMKITYQRDGEARKSVRFNQTCP